MHEMKIYTSNSDGKKLQKVKDLDMGILIASSSTMPQKKYAEKGEDRKQIVSCALDNGAFSCWNKGYPFMESVFLKCLEKAYFFGIKLDFIVCPDLITKGMESFEFSEKWRTEYLCGAPKLALAVQDGMTPSLLTKYTAWEGYSHIFVGGSVKWKWEMAEDWVKFAHDNELKCHIGRAGRLENMKHSYKIGADSTDSSSIVRNDSWHIVEEFIAWRNSYEGVIDV